MCLSMPAKWLQDVYFYTEKWLQDVCFCLRWFDSTSKCYLVLNLAFNLSLIGFWFCKKTKKNRVRSWAHLSSAYTWALAQHDNPTGNKVTTVT